MTVEHVKARLELSNRLTLLLFTIEPEGRAMELDSYILSLIEAGPINPQNLYEIVFRAMHSTIDRRRFDITIDDLIESGRVGCLAFKNPPERRESLVLYKLGLSYREVKNERLYARKDT